MGRRKQGIVYLIHLSSPIAHARHYVGYTNNIETRLAEHRSGTGARLLAVAVEQAIPFEIVRTWEGDRDFERQIKNRKNTPRYCPICNQRLQNPTHK